MTARSVVFVFLQLATIIVAWTMWGWLAGIAVWILGSPFMYAETRSWR